MRVVGHGQSAERRGETAGEGRVDTVLARQVPADVILLFGRQRAVEDDDLGDFQVGGTVVAAIDVIGIGARVIVIVDAQDHKLVDRIYVEGVSYLDTVAVDRFGMLVTVEVGVTILEQPVGIASAATSEHRSMLNPRRLLVAEHRVDHLGVEVASHVQIAARAMGVSAEVDHVQPVQAAADHSCRGRT